MTESSVTSALQFDSQCPFVPLASEGLWNLTGVGALRSAVVWGLTRTEMQLAIHALRGASDSSVRYDGVAAYAASLSLPWLS